MNSAPELVTGSYELRVVLDEAEQFARKCLPGGWLLGKLVRLCGSFWRTLAYICQFYWKVSTWLCRPAKDSFRIIELLAILIAIFAFFLELGNRQEEREARAWQLLTTKASGNSGKVGALEFLNREEQWVFILKWWPLPQSTERADNIGDGKTSSNQDPAQREGSLLKWLPQLSIQRGPLNSDDAIEMEGRKHREEFWLSLSIHLPEQWPLNKDRMTLEGIDLTPPSIAPWEEPDDGAPQIPYCEQKTYLAKAKLPKARLRGANLRCVDLTDAKLQEADFRGADFRDTFLDGVKLQGADLGGADLRYTWMLESDLQGAILNGSDLRGANVINSDLQGAVLTWSDLRKTNFSTSKLQGADLRASQLRGAKFLGANLKGVDLRQVVGMNCEQLIEAINWWLAYRDGNLTCGKSIPTYPP